MKRDSRVEVSTMNCPFLILELKIGELLNILLGTWINLR